MQQQKGGKKKGEGVLSDEDSIVGWRRGSCRQDFLGTRRSLKRKIMQDRGKDVSYCLGIVYKITRFLCLQ